MTGHHWIIGLFFIIFHPIQDVFGLKNVALTIEPSIVQRLNHSTLRCSYDLEGGTLYSVKWYRGNIEFYRYTPHEKPSTKVFPFKGITVDINNSNSTQVVLRDIEFNLSGNFTCEVTTDIPTILIGSDTKRMLVVQLPESTPKISVGRDPLDYGDTLRANCSSPPSRPPALLKFILNNRTVSESKRLTDKKRKETDWSDLSLEMVLSSIDFNQGRLILRCVAQVENIYNEDATLELDSARHPVPERVSAVDSANCDCSHRIPLVLLLVYILFLCS